MIGRARASAPGWWKLAWTSRTTGWALRGWISAYTPIMRPRLHSTRSSDSRSREPTEDLHSATASTWTPTSWPVCKCRGRLRFPDTGHDQKEVNVGRELSHGPVRSLRQRLRQKHLVHLTHIPQSCL